MDLGAYMQINNLQFVLDKLNLDIPRLRGLRLMENQIAFSNEDFDRVIALNEVENAVQWLKQHEWHMWNSEKDTKKHPAFIYSWNEELNMKEITAIDFSKIHGKDKKIIKFKNKQDKKKILADYGMYNQFAGKKVLYVHTRLGGWNQEYYKEEIKRITSNPHYLGCVEDWYDLTYCTFYFDISDIDLSDLKENN